ncbi:hypothetical protein L1049_003071 [Liquidambar formosana]|uniref:Zinc finger BED domain-containing protein RICESLEEPER 2-like n=1 Tax=Liquidambar formosana TaxID=63359 RepID=A0AAP0NLJ7_LIQFO
MEGTIKTNDLENDAANNSSTNAATIKDSSSLPLKPPKKKSSSTVHNHKGKTLGKVVEMCLLSWGIKKFLSVTVDNASSNNLLVQYLKTNTSRRKDVICGHEFLYVRCCAYILNLIVCDGLKEMDESIIKVRNVVRYVRSSPSRMGTFKLCVEKEGITCKHGVCLDVSTRCNFTFLMLDRDEKFEHAFKRLECEDKGFMSLFRDGEIENEEGEDECLSGRGKGKEKRKLLGPPDFVD